MLKLLRKLFLDQRDYYFGAAQQRLAAATSNASIRSKDTKRNNRKWNHLKIAWKANLYISVQSHCRLLIWGLAFSLGPKKESLAFFLANLNSISEQSPLPPWSRSKYKTDHITVNVYDQFTTINENFNRKRKKKLQHLVIITLLG